MSSTYIFGIEEQNNIVILPLTSNIIPKVIKKFKLNIKIKSFLWEIEKVLILLGGLTLFLIDWLYLRHFDSIMYRA